MESRGSGTNASRSKTNRYASYRASGLCLACGRHYSSNQLYATNTRLYHCPSDTEMRRQWALLCGVDPSDKNVSLRVCSKHFRFEEQHTMRCRLMGDKCHWNQKGHLQFQGQHCLLCTLQKGSLPSIGLPEPSSKVKALLQRAKRVEKRENRRMVENLIKQRRYVPQVPQSERLLGAPCGVEEDYEVVSGPVDDNEAYLFSDSDNEAGMEAADDKRSLELEQEPAVQLTELCRVCSAVAAGREGTLHVFQEQGVARHLRDKINLCLPIQVSETDALPLLVCASCLVALETSYSLSQTCRQADRDLQLMQAEQLKLFEPEDLCPPASSSTVTNSSTSRLEAAAAPAAVVPILLVRIPAVHTEQPPLVQTEPLSPARHALVFPSAPQDEATSVTKTVLDEAPQNIDMSAPRNTVKSLISSKRIAILSSSRKPATSVCAPRKSTIPKEPSFECLIPPTENVCVINVPKSPPFNAGSELNCDEHFGEDLESDSSKREIRVKAPSGFTPDPLPAFECVLCKKFYSKFYSYALHMSKTHAKYLCQTCPDFEGKSEEEQKTHRKSKKCIIKTNTCQVCGKIYSSNTGLSRHMYKHRDPSSKFKCASCDKVFDSPHTLKRHSAVHKPRQYQCEVCSKLFTFQVKLLQHKNTVHGVKWTFTCTICQMEHDSEAKIKEHVIQSHPTEWKKIPDLRSFYLKTSPFQCAHCAKYFGARHHIVLHLKYTHGIADGNESSRTPTVSLTAPRFMCEVCGKCFKVKQLLMIHSNVHKEVKDFQCSICDKSFCQKTLLMDHTRLHTGETPFSCDLCELSFRTKNLLKLHRLDHSEYRPYVCNYCGKGFKTKEKLTVHERVHTNERPITCKFCNQGFKQFTDRNRHVRAKHKNEQKNE